MSSESLVSPINCTDSWALATLGILSKKIGSGATPTGGQAAYQPERTNFALVRSQNVFDRMFSETGLAFISDEQAKGLRGAQLEADDILLNITGDGVTFSRSCMIPETALPACVNQHVAIIRLKQELAIPGYVLSYLTHPSVKSYIESFNAGGSRRAITKGQIESFVVPLPPLEIQKSIASLLQVFDDRITLLRETNKTLESTAQAIFKSWFVDFDPVRAKMEGRQPEGIDEATAALLPDSFEESELGLVPKGWSFSTVGKLFTVTMGQSPPGNTYNMSGNGLPFYQGRTDFGFRFPSKRVFCVQPSRVAVPGDTLVSVRAPVGDVNMAIEQCCIGRGVAAVRHPLNYRGFTFYTMKELSSQFQKYDSEGTVFGSINKKDFEALSIVSPGQDALRLFDETTTPLDSRVVENEESIRTLVSLRDTLLPRLISGQLRLPEAQEHVENALS